MKKIMAIALIMAMGAVACQKEAPDYTDNSTHTDGDFISFSADFVSLASKTGTSYNDESKTLTLTWEEGDAVGVYSSDAPILFKATNAGETTTLSTNIKVAQAASYSALYPYSSEALMDGGLLKATVPSEQAAKADELQYHLAVAHTTSTNFSFKNAAAAIRLNVQAENVTKIVIKADGGEQIAGDIKINTETAAYSDIANGSATINLVPASGYSTINPGIYYVSVIPQNLLAGLTVTYNIGENAFEQSSQEAIEMTGNSLIVCDPFIIAVEGSQSNPFTVGSIEDLKALPSKLALDVPNYVVLTKDIDMSGVGEWSPICNTRTDANIPELHFDGKNYTISNFAPTSVKSGEGGNQLSLFGSLYGSCKNLNMTNVSLQLTGESTVATVAGFAGKTGTDKIVTLFENVHVSGAISAKKVVGGFVANVYNAKFVNCSADVDLTTSDNQNGGFVARCGASGSTAIFEDCHATGDITNSSTKARYVGGFYGGEANSADMTFTRCWASGNITADYQLGALIGYLDAGTITVTDCYATGNINVTSSTYYSKQQGGIVGVNKGDLTITRCYYTGSITSTKAESVGGILGLGASGNVKISNCFSTGNLTSPTYGVGGIIGYTKSTSALIENCYAAGTLSAAKQVGGIVGLAETTTTVKNCKHNTNIAAVIGAETVAATQEGNSKLTDAEVADYSTASKIASKLGWSTNIWDLSGTTPQLK